MASAKTTYYVSSVCNYMQIYITLVQPKLLSLDVIFFKIRTQLI
jgi:hypothetical protein